MKIILKIQILVLILPLACVAQNDTIHKGENIRVVPNSVAKELTEGEAYRMLYDGQVKANSEILKTVYYALGGLGTAVLLVFASNWWFNEKKVKDTALGITNQILDAKKTILLEATEKMNHFTNEKNSELHTTFTRLQKELSDLSESMRSNFAEFQEKTRLEIREDNKTLTSSYEERVKSFSENILMQINTIEILLNERLTNISSKFSTFEKDINQKVDKKTGTLESRLTNQVNIVKRDQLFAAAELAEFNKFYPKAFRNWLGVALTEQKMGRKTSETVWDYLYSSLVKAEYIWEDEDRNLRQLMQDLDGYDEIKTKIIDSLQNKEIKLFNKPTASK